MIRNYFKIALRNILKQKAYAFINIVGLTIGIAAFIFIMMFIQHELSIDSNIQDQDRWFRCVELQHAQGVGDQHVAVTMGPLGPSLTKDFPEVEMAVRVMSWGSLPLTYDNQQYTQDNIVFTDPEVFNFFDIKLLDGDTATALSEPNSIVMSEKNAVKYFGSVEEALGKVVKLNNFDSFKVTAIMEDQTLNSHYPIEMLVPFDYMESRYAWLKSWGTNTMATYIRLIENTDEIRLQEKFAEWLLTYITPENPETMFQLYLQPVGDIHLKSNHIKFQRNYNQGNIKMVYVFSIIAILIIVIACINFINIAIARAFKRAKEVGMRKVLGATRLNLMYQFLGESIIITSISIIFALGIVQLLLPMFIRILGVDLEVDFINNRLFNIGLLGILLFVSLASGSYPAFYLSRFKPLQALRTSLDKKAGGSGNISKILVAIQFVISIGLIFSVMVIYNQLHYVMNKDMGFNFRDVIGIPLLTNKSTEDVKRIKNELRQHPNIIDMAHCAEINGVSGNQSTLSIDDTMNTRITCRIGYVDYNFFEMMEIPVVLGRNFSREYATDTNAAVIINEAALEFLDWDNPLEMSFMPFMGDTITKRRVIGVIRDYHYYSLHSKIEPAVYLIDPEQSWSLVVKMSAQDQDETIQFLEDTWASLFPSVPFEYDFASDVLKEQYEDEENSLMLFTYFSLLSIIISCLGLYGLTTFLVEQRKKEIGIRKVFGGSVWQVINLLIRNYMMLVVIAGIIASPIAWYIMNETLETFAYRISISWYYFVIAILTAVIIAISTIIFHASKAALMNPADAIRCE
jgi:putative ABC transport system permease protein